MSNESQRRTFLSGEADRYFERNTLNFAQCLNDPWNQHLAELVPAGGRVLEIGCSDGRRLAAIDVLTDRRAGELCGVDPSGEAVAAGMAEWPRLDLRLGTADAVPLDGTFDLVLFGFCLYLCDRDLLQTAVAEGDRLTKDGGALAIIDFDPPSPRRRSYRHLDGVWSWKMDYPALFLANPAYSLASKLSGSHAAFSWERKAAERVALTVLRKAVLDSYQHEPDS